MAVVEALPVSLATAGGPPAQKQKNSDGDSRRQNLENKARPVSSHLFYAVRPFSTLTPRLERADKSARGYFGNYNTAGQRSQYMKLVDDAAHDSQYESQLGRQGQNA